MIRNFFLNRYKECQKSLLDTEENLLRQDDEFIVNTNRPIADNQINQIPSKVLYSFVEDVLSDHQTASVLYSKNTKNEIQLYKNRNRVVSRSVISQLKQRPRKSTAEGGESKALTRKKDVNSKYSEIKDQIDNYKLNKSAQMSFLIQKNDIFYDDIKAQNKPNSIKSYYQPVNLIRIKSYKRAIQRCKSQMEIKPNFQLPNVKLDLNDVYSRLYHNAVHLEKAKDEPRIRLKSRKDVKEEIDSNRKTKPQHFHLKQVINSSDGKNYTMKITDQMFNKCFIKHSGGPKANISMRYDIGEADGKPHLKDENLIDLTEIKDQNENSYLHEAVANNSEKFVEYYLFKKLSPNQQNIHGNTPLHYAMQVNNKGIIKKLLEAKGNPHIKNNNKETPFDLASLEVKKMLKAEVQPKQKNPPNHNYLSNFLLD